MSLKVVKDKLKGWKTLILSLLLALSDLLPDLIDAMAGIDWSPLLPDGLGVKIAGWLLVVRALWQVIRDRKKATDG